MPCFPDFVGAVELARQQTLTAGQADPVAQYFNAPQAGMAVHERGPDGLLAAVRAHDDVAAPFERPASEDPR